MKPIKSTKNTHTLAMNERQNRRSDTDVRHAISAFQEFLFDPDASSHLFQLTLQFLAEISNSQYGECCVAAEGAHLPIETDTPLTTLLYQNTPPFVNTQVLAAWVGQKSLLTSPTFYNYPIASGTKSVLLNDQEFRAMMILPIIVHNKLRAVCILGSDEHDYDGAIVHKLKPIIGALMCTIQSAESVMGNFLGISDNIASSRYLNSLMSSSPLGIVVIDCDDKIVLSNPVAHTIFYNNSRTKRIDDGHGLTGQKIQILIPEYHDLFQWSKQQDRYGNDEYPMSPRIWEDRLALRYDGTRCIVNLSIFRHASGSKRFTTLQIQDMTSIRESTEKYKLASQQLNALTQLAPVAIIHVDKEWNCVFANDKWFEFSGFIQDESLGKNWINAIHVSEVADFLQALHGSLSKGSDYSQELRLVTPLGTTKWVNFSMRVLFSADDEVEGFLGTCADVTEHYITQEKLRHIAEYDGLTGLANRVLFQDRLQQAFLDSQRDNATITLFFLDLDGFKDVNDTLGHNIGDILLQKVAERLLNTVRKNDTVARFGGDEFVILLGHDEHVSNEKVVAEKLIESIAQPYIIEKHELVITTSLGIAKGNHHDATPESLLRNADFALYSAKRDGKNKYQLFNLELELGSKERVALLNELRVGLKRNRFHLYFQPICDCCTASIVGFEALLRFKDNKGLIIGPDQFIPLLEENGIILDVGRWVINETCRQLSEWQQQDCFGDISYITFNVSARQLLEDSFVPHIQDCCLTHKVNPHQLVMEMTESVFINKPEKIKPILNRVKEMGIRLALDDFGTGYSSLSYLQNYPFDIIKIDKSFLDDLNGHENNKKIVKAIIALATSLELQIVAEGVEVEYIQKLVTSLGAHYFQGYLVSKPVPTEQAIALLAASHLRG